MGSTPGGMPSPPDVADPADHRRQPVFRYLKCPIPQSAQRAHHRPADDERGGQRDPEKQGDREAIDDRQGDRAVVQRRAAGDH